MLIILNIIQILFLMLHLRLFSNKFVCDKSPLKSMDLLCFNFFYHEKLKICYEEKSYFNKGNFDSTVIGNLINKKEKHVLSAGVTDTAS